jgi:hypothetical protein
VATLIHIDRFDFDTIFGWFWTIVYSTIPAVLFLLIFLQVRQPGNDDLARDPLPAWLRGLLMLQGATMIGVGVALFAAPTDADTLWPWMLTPLTARAVGSFVIGFGAAAVYASVENDLNRFYGAAPAYAALGVLQLLALAIYSEDLSGGSTDTWIYVGFLVSALAVGIYALVRARSSSRARSTSS